ncbi:hypothetical protein [Microbacterium radiodurans]|uniref:Uncharacterized protein n=1 Tax=Microbacterium radiodurans TaxID=661398 RepID=A0A5J5IUD0_9MICO|nr:hypothetical protein [Microbacterium radiodurans]KAA9089199.1 hypothetical protein F6B42_01495 [Microbacterium radiodurans]
MSRETSAREHSSDDVLDTAVRARARLSRVRRDLEGIRRAGAVLAVATAWRARAADAYREGLASWRDRLDESAAHLEAFDDELRSVVARLEMQGELLRRSVR